MLWYLVVYIVVRYAALLSFVEHCDTLWYFFVQIVVRCGSLLYTLFYIVVRFGNNVVRYGISWDVVVLCRKL